MYRKISYYILWLKTDILQKKGKTQTGKREEKARLRKKKITTLEKTKPIS